MADLPVIEQSPHTLLWGDVLVAPLSALLSSTSDNDGSFWCLCGPLWATLGMLLVSNADPRGVVLGETEVLDDRICGSRVSIGALMGPLPSGLAGSVFWQEEFLAGPLRASALLLALPRWLVPILDVELLEASGRAGE